MTDQEAKTRILEATVALLNEGVEPAKITVRQIASRANVGIGSINYYFQSRDQLLHQAVMRITGNIAAAWYEPAQHQSLDPATRLKRLFKESAVVLMRYRKFAELSIAYDLLHGDLQVPTLLLPLLREIFGSRKNEVELRLLAFQLIVSTQVAYLRSDALERYTGINFGDDAQRDAALEMLIDNLVGTGKQEG
jgi:AcrR family transcriptional regulator